VPHSDPVGPENLMATIMNVLFDVGKLRLERGVPRRLLAPMESHEPIKIGGVYESASEEHR
jgi:hypothetical protein